MSSIHSFSLNDCQSDFRGVLEGLQKKEGMFSLWFAHSDENSEEGHLYKVTAPSCDNARWVIKLDNFHCLIPKTLAKNERKQHTATYELSEKPISNKNCLPDVVPSPEPEPEPDSKKPLPYTSYHPEELSPLSNLSTKDDTGSNKQTLTLTSYKVGTGYAPENQEYLTQEASIPTDASMLLPRSSTKKEVQESIFKNQVRMFLGSECQEAVHIPNNDVLIKIDTQKVIDEASAIHLLEAHLNSPIDWLNFSKHWQKMSMPDLLNPECILALTKEHQKQLLLASVHYNNQPLFDLLVNKFDTQELSELTLFGTPLLLYATEHNLFFLVNRLLTRGCLISKIKASDGSTALKQAVSNNNLPMVECLLNFTEPTEDKISGLEIQGLLREAAKSGNIAIAKLLLEYGGTNNLECLPAPADLVKYAIKKHQSDFILWFIDLVDKPNIFGTEVLQYAAEHGSQFVVEKLLSIGIDHKTCSINIFTTLAAKLNWGKGDLAFLNTASQCNCTAMLSAFLGREIRENSTIPELSLHTIAAEGCEKKLKNFLAEHNKDNNLNLNVKNEKGETALYEAIDQRSPNDDIIEVLVEAGADFSTCEDKDGWTALFAAIRKSKFHLVENMLKKDAIHINHLTSKQMSPVTFAVTMLHKYNTTTKMVELLLKYGANLNPQKAELPLSNAVSPIIHRDNLKCTEIYGWLLEKGAKQSMRNVRGLPLLHEIIRIHKLYVNRREDTGFNIIKALVERPDIDLNVTDIQERTAIEYAKSLKLKKVIKLIEKRTKELEKQNSNTLSEDR